jgi:hypothetical protein
MSVIENLPGLEQVEVAHGKRPSSVIRFDANTRPLRENHLASCVDFCLNHPVALHRIRGMTKELRDASRLRSRVEFVQH